MTYWKHINYHSETIDMNNADKEGEDEDGVSKVDEIHATPAALFSTDSKRIERYSGVVIKGFNPTS